MLALNKHQIANVRFAAMRPATSWATIERKLMRLLAGAFVLWYPMTSMGQQLVSEVHAEAVPYLGENGHQAWRRYKQLSIDKAFAISKTGSFGYVSGKPSKQLASQVALAACEKHGLVCLLFAVNDEVVWDAAFSPGGTGEPSPSPVEIAAKKEASALLLLQKAEIAFSSRTNDSWGRHVASTANKTYFVYHFAKSGCYQGTAPADFSITANGDLEVTTPMRTQIAGCMGFRVLINPLTGTVALFDTDAKGNAIQGPYFYRLLKE